MLTLFHHIASSFSSASLKPLKTLESTDTPVSLIEQSACYLRELKSDPSCKNKVKIFPNELETQHHLYKIYQLNEYLIEGKTCFYENELGSIEVFPLTEKIWLRWHNTLCQASLDKLNEFLYELENSQKRLSFNFLQEFLEKNHSRPKR